MKRLLLFFSFLGVVTHMAWTQPRFTRQQLQEDADTLYARIIRIHPDPFFRYPAEDFQSEYRRMREELADSMTAVDFYRILIPVVYKLRDGHMQVDLRSVQLDRKDVFFPLTVDINPTDSSMRIRSDYSGSSGIPAGASIVRINGRTPARIVSGFLPYFAGELDRRRVAYMSAFMDFQQLFYILYGEDRFRIEYKDNGKEKVVELPAVEIPNTKFREMITEWYGKPDYSVFFDEENNLAVIEFNRFNNPEKFTSFAAQTFKEIQEKKITNLIIDMRWNGGGNSLIGDEFFQYISPAPFRQMVRSTVRLLPQMKLQMPEEIRSLPDYTLHTFSMENIPLRENPYRFSGNVYLLTGAVSYSSAGSFASAFKEYRMGTIVGEATGMPAIAFGNPVPIVLPNTKITVPVTTGKMFVRDDYRLQGVMPDYEVSASDAMEFAIGLIEGKNE